MSKTHIQVKSDLSIDQLMRSLREHVNSDDFTYKEWRLEDAQLFEHMACAIRFGWRMEGLDPQEAFDEPVKDDRYILPNPNEIDIFENDLTKVKIRSGV